MESKLSTILVTTDFSDLGNAAVPVAFRLAEADGARVVLVHVIEGMTPSPLYAHYYPTPSPEQRRELEAEVRAKLEAAVPPSSRKRSSEIRVLHGEPAAEICRAAEEARANLVVISSHGRTGLKHFLLGSVAERVVRHSRCSVLVLREARHAAAK